MVAPSRAVIVAAAETPYTRHPALGTTTESLLADAFLAALERAGIERDSVDGLGVASFTLAPDHAIDLAWRLGLRPRWLMDDANGGASGINLLQHAVRAIEAGDAETIVLVSGDQLDRDSFRTLVESYNRATAEQLAGIPTGGPERALRTAHAAAHGEARAHARRLRAHRRRAAPMGGTCTIRRPRGPGTSSVREIIRFSASSRANVPASVHLRIS